MAFQVRKFSQCFVIDVTFVISIICHRELEKFVNDNNLKFQYQILSSLPYSCILVIAPLVGEMSIVMSVSALMEPHVQTFHFSTTNGRSVFLWQRCHTLCISGFVDDVMLAGIGDAKDF